MKGLVSHIVLLVVASGLALSVWTRDEQPEKSTADLVEVWNGSPDSTTVVSYESKSRKVRLENRKDATGRYYVASVDREEPGMVHPATGDAGAPPPAPKKQEKKVFIAVKAADELISKLAPLKALRSVGKVEAKRLEEFGLDKPEGTLKVNVAGKEHSLVIGGTTPGGSERYAKYSGNGEVYAIPGDIVQSLQFAEDRLMEREFHAFAPESVSRVRIAKAGKFRDIVRLTGKKDGWADSANPEKLDETVGNWMSKVDRLRVQEYVEKPQTALKPENATVRVEYFEGSKPIGYLELYKVPGEKGNDFFVKTEHGRWYVKVAAMLAEQIEQDLASVLK